MDCAEFTKSERERAAEILFVWRNSFGWSVPRKSKQTSKRKITVLGLLTLLSLAFVIGLTLRA